jgi:hypothetical protein
LCITFHQVSLMLFLCFIGGIIIIQRVMQYL